MLAGRKYTFKTSADGWYSSSEWSQALVKTSNLCNVEAATFGHMTHTHMKEDQGIIDFRAKKQKSLTLLR
jgi:hypothetical protein